MDLSLQSRLTIAEAMQLPCFGLCGKSWEEADGGWMEFEGDGCEAHLAPRWFCDECSRVRSAGESCQKYEENLKN